MAISSTLSRSFEALAQSMRLLSEAVLKYDELITIDRPEAIGNVEQSFASVLNGFHSLGDAVQKEDDGPDWSNEPRIGALRVLRNARHHNHANGIRTLLKYHSEVANDSRVPRRYLVNNAFADQTELNHLLFLPVSLSDIIELFDIDPGVSRIRREFREQLISYMGIRELVSRAETLGFQMPNVFTTMNPMFLAAGHAMSGYLAEKVATDSVESKSFMDLFLTSPVPDLSAPKLREITFAFPA